MKKETNKPSFLDMAYADITALLKEYQVKLPDEEEDKAFQEDLITLITDKLKGSFKNGIRVGVKKQSGEKGSERQAYKKDE